MLNENQLHHHSNKRIQSQLHSIDTLDKQKRGIHSFDDIRYLLADREDGSRNSFTDAYSHHSIEIEINLTEKSNVPGDDLQVVVRIPKSEKRFVQKINLVIIRVFKNEPLKTEIADEYALSN